MENKRVETIKSICINSINENGKTTKGIDLNMLTLLTGYNGSGKSFLLVSCYAVTEVARVVSHGITGENLKQAAQFVVDSCYRPQVLNDQLCGTFESGATVDVMVEKGVVTEVKFSGWENSTVAGIRYMSSHMRTFESISHYLLARNFCMKDKSKDEAFKELCKDFKLYDVQYLESLIMKMPLKFDEQTRDSLKNNFDVKDDVESFDVDLERKDFFYTIKGSGDRRYMTTLGKGHQSIFNMIVGQL